MDSDQEPELAFEIQEINRLIRTELRPINNWIGATQPWTKEGKRARAKLKELLRQIEDLAILSGCQEVIDIMEKIRLIPGSSITRPEELPNWDAGGSLN